MSFFHQAGPICACRLDSGRQPFAIALILLAFIALPICPALAKGRFDGQIITAWDANGRDMHLRQDLTYVDPKGIRWHVPSGAIVNGASIPRMLWSVIGGPFTGKYRGASVVHDYYCVVKTRNSDTVHKVFYDAMITSGVSPNWAMLLYQAVARFGPRWRGVREVEPGCEVITEDNVGDCAENSQALASQPARNPSDAELRNFLGRMRARGLGKQVDKLMQGMKSQ